MTLNKSEALFSPSTRYRDLALGPSLFHWESQSTTTAASPTGQRYIHHEARGSRVLLFVREHRREGGPRRGCHRAVSVSGVCPHLSHTGETADGDPLAAAAADSGGVRARAGVGGLRAWS